MDKPCSDLECEINPPTIGNNTIDGDGGIGHSGLDKVSALLASLSSKCGFNFNYKRMIECEYAKLVRGMLSVTDENSLNRLLFKYGFKHRQTFLNIMVQLQANGNNPNTDILNKLGPIISDFLVSQLTSPLKQNIIFEISCDSNIPNSKLGTDLNLDLNQFGGANACDPQDSELGPECVISISANIRTKPEGSKFNSNPERETRIICKSNSAYPIQLNPDVLEVLHPGFKENVLQSSNGTVVLDKNWPKKYKDATGKDPLKENQKNNTIFIIEDVSCDDNGNYVFKIKGMNKIDSFSNDNVSFELVIPPGSKMPYNGGVTLSDPNDPTISGNYALESNCKGPDGRTVSQLMEKCCPSPTPTSTPGATPSSTPTPTPTPTISSPTPTPSVTPTLTPTTTSTPTPTLTPYPYDPYDSYDPYTPYAYTAGVSYKPLNLTSAP
jgi:hypothetical protein